MGPLLQTATSEALGGACAGVVADSVLYAVDSAKVRAQTTPAASGGWKILFRGLVPTITLGSVPIFGSFFFCFALVKTKLLEQKQDALLPFAAAACAVPATLVGVPADVLKKRLVLGIDPNVAKAFSHILSEQGWRGLFAGWHVNLVKDIPFAGVKIGFYEAFVSQWRAWNGLSSKEALGAQGAAICGIASGVACGVLTCPLDVVNTRIKASATPSRSILQVGRHMLKTEGVFAFFRGVAMRSFVLAVGSSIFWPIQHGVSCHLNGNT
ncbi:SAMC1 [Symbiodinium natans]|uniref:SAMC1 protein n=1 Tax=Symbiodinium natans TaxID=878477 RepID=A0A812V3A3_9DINO|nr:SAMC1 [Symbiodinium natans]